ncbi:MAG TPA: CusA/CzcA family heavy metal efflux RND transporter [Polyangiaceae bacterium]|nr:CusA/CzcA family heavy metal efflux RND transporter [Polyangiaceae bacterium]
MLEALVRGSIRARGAVLAALGLLLCLGAWAARTLPIDALPDVASSQVSVLTQAAGMSPSEMESTVTMPIENALNGVPGSVSQRSVSRSGLSAVTVVFRDDVDVWFARQLVLERLRDVELAPRASAPELAPVSSGLGEIFQFVVRSDQHSAMQLRTLLDWEIVPKLRNVPGVVEVNTMGGDLKQFQVHVDRARLKALGLTLGDVVHALEGANLNAGGGYIDRRDESFTVRGQGLLRNVDEIGNVVVRNDARGTPVLVRHVADIKVGSALRQGVITHDGKGEAVTGIVMMLLGENSRTVVHAVAERVHEIERDLPPGVHIDVVYDRSDFVGRTLATVMKNLAEGVAIVTLVLVVFLGTLRGAVAVVLGIPCAMSFALFGMHLFRVTGDLMSLGAIDFGFLVDGPIVILEAVMTATAGRRLVDAARARAYADLASSVVRPVAFAVGIIMLVYVPLLALEGVEGKMFRPMAVTMACALLGALVYAVCFFPAVLVSLVRPASGHGPRWLERLGELYASALPAVVGRRAWYLAGAASLFALAAWLFARQGAEFVPRIFEGDAVVTVRRAPSISLVAARDLDLATERVLHGFPEVATTLGMTGRAEVATDPVGNDNTDIFVRLRPPATWTSAADFDELSEQFKNGIENRVPGTFVSVSQPIEDRTNELISGSRADVQIQIFGDELEKLTELAAAVGARVKHVAGTGDVRVERILGAPTIDAVADRVRLARYGVRVEDAFEVLSAAREGVPVGRVYEAERRFELRVLEPPARPTADGIGDLFVTTATGANVPLREVLTLSESEGPTAIRREDRRRAVRVDVNLRGRDLVSWVGEAERAVRDAVPLPHGYRVEWGGQFENFERASARLAVVVPAVVAVIFGMLLWMFQNLRFAAAVFALVPLSLAGGMLGLVLRATPFSLPAAVGFIALGGIAVLNGVVMASEVRQRLDAGMDTAKAVSEGCARTLRAVLTTAAVAALGFLPMAIATGAGAEVQRPLATAVVVGMAISALLTLFVLPGVFALLLKGYRRAPEREPSSGDERAERGDEGPVLGL